MGITHIATIAAISFTGLLPASCKKTFIKTQVPTVITSVTGTNGSATNSIAHNLGELALTNHTETCVALGGGKTCFFTTKLIDRSNAQLTLTLESKNAAGKIQDLSVTEVVVKSGKPFEVALGNCNLAFTPQVVSP